METRILGENIVDLSIFDYDLDLKIFYMKEYHTLQNM